MSHRVSALLIDDDARLGALVKEYLGQNDVDVTVIEDGERGLREIAQHHYDIVLLDLMLPGIDGLEVCRRLRSRPEQVLLPVLMLTAKGDDVDKVVGLEVGADDYLAKPFNPRELLARIRALLRRSTSTGDRDRFRIGELEVQFSAREVTLSGKRQVLTTFEFELLSCLARAAGRVLSREQLMEAVGRGEDFDTFDRSIDVHISKLRSKIELDPKMPRYIKTVRGIGYVLARED